MKDITLYLESNNKSREITYSLDNNYFDLVISLQKKIQDDSLVAKFINDNKIGEMKNIKFNSIESGVSLLILEKIDNEFKILLNEKNGKLSFPLIITNSFNESEEKALNYLNKNLLNDQILLENSLIINKIYKGKDKFDENYDSRGNIETNVMFLNITNEYEYEHKLRSILVNRENLVEKINNLVLENERDRDILKDNIDLIINNIDIRREKSIEDRSLAS